MFRSSMVPESDALLICEFYSPLSRGFYPLQKSPPLPVSSIEGVETDTYLLVSAYGKGVEGVLVIDSCSRSLFRMSINLV